jgi:hypothetical protein
MKSKPARLLAVVLALAVIAHARVALLPGWVVPAPAVFLAVTLAAVGMFAASIVLRLRFDRMPLAPAAAPGAALEVK